ncbi:MAG: hypothetical protein ACYDGR_04050 [Candidatus Dormibacteria bacterium]
MAQLLAAPVAWAALAITLAMGLASSALGLTRGASIHGVIPGGIQNLQYTGNSVAFALVGFSGRVGESLAFDEILPQMA